MQNKHNNNIFLYLFKKALLALLILLATQIFFYLYNLRIFHLANTAEGLGILWGNLKFGLATIGLLLLPFFFLNLLPFHFRWNKHFHRIIEGLFYYLPMLFIIGTNITDGAYYQFTYRRLSGEIFHYLGISGDMGALWPHFLIDYWPATVCGIVLIILLFVFGAMIRLAPRNKFNKSVLSDIIGFVLGLGILFLMLRGGVSTKVENNNTARFCQAKNSALVTNSAYNIINTFHGDTFPEMKYMEQEQADQLFNPTFVIDTAANAATRGEWEMGAGLWIRMDTLSHQDKLIHANVVVIVLESFSQEYMGCYNKNAKTSFTPFLDSLSNHCIVYQGRANGKKSIEGIPAIFASRPTLMTFPLTMSDYADNDYNALPAILHRNGYHTAFFHGSYNGVMGFDKLSRQLGFEEYYGKDEYMSDRHSQPTDYDGCWGIFDEHFLQFFNRKLSTFKEPFMTGIFTLSSHHPYTMQPGHENDFQEGPHPLCRVVSYTDNALRKFFDEARKTDWYENTIFVITADHSGQGLTPAYNDYNGWYRIPMMFYIPGQENAHKVYSRLMQQTDIVPTLLDYLGQPCRTTVFGTSAFRNADGWQVAYGNGYYQIETADGVSVTGQGQDETHGKDHTDLLKAYLQQYGQVMRNGKTNKK